MVFNSRGYVLFYVTQTSVLPRTFRVVVWFYYAFSAVYPVYYLNSCIIWEVVNSSERWLIHADWWVVVNSCWVVVIPGQCWPVWAEHCNHIQCTCIVADESTCNLIYSLNTWDIPTRYKTCILTYVNLKLSLLIAIGVSIYKAIVQEYTGCCSVLERRDR